MLSSGFFEAEPVIRLPDGFLTAGLPKLRYRQGTWLETDPLLNAIAGQETADATAADECLYSLTRDGRTKIGRIGYALLACTAPGIPAQRRSMPSR